MEENVWRMSLEKFKSSADPAAKGVGKWEMGKGESGNWGARWT